MVREVCVRKSSYIFYGFFKIYLYKLQLHKTFFYHIYHINLDFVKVAG